MTSYTKPKELVPADDIFKDLDKKYSRQGNILAGLRLREGLTQTQLAKKIEGSQTSIAAIENGKRSIEKTLAHKLAGALKTNAKVLLES